MGKLYLVPTPIGNLGDITLRAIEVLAKVDLILAEDTRITKKLLNHYEIKTKTKSYHIYNEHKKLNEIINLLISDNNIALVSDSGSPCISDPGYMLVREVISKGIDLESLPGASSIIPAITQSGFPTTNFIFEGFLPKKKGRQKKILELSKEKRTIVLFESPYRLIKLLNEIKDICGVEKNISISREISKIFEETIRGTVDECLLHFEEKEPKGEFVICLQGFKS
tara:strand:+ start:7236 stop:7910 length:675 start_codon:yes stop_codon:yes gene_type:complete